MATEPQQFQERHLSRNVPKDFNACLERERLVVCGPGNRPGRRTPQIMRMLQLLSDDPLSEEDHSRIANDLIEVWLRYLVLTKTLDQSIPPTPIMKALKSLQNRAMSTERVLSDEDRDAFVRDTMGLEPDAPIPGTRSAFDQANTIAERAAIAHVMAAELADSLGEMAGFFDYKAGLTPRGNQTQFGIIYAIVALAAIFEAENKLDRKVTVSRNIPLKDDKNDYARDRYTGPFLRFATEFFHLVDDSLFSRLEPTSFYERVRKLTISRRSDPDLHKLLDGAVSTPELLEFMDRAEVIR